MTPMEQYPKRKTNRLSSDLYGKNGSYFITICSKDRANLFWRFPVGAALRRPSSDDPRLCPPSGDPALVGGGVAADSPPLRPPSEDMPPRPPEVLNDHGLAVFHQIEKIDDIYDGIITVDHAVVMPNHVHLLLSIHSERSGGRRNAAPTISSVVNQFKGSVTKAIGSPCWQKSFYDRSVRDEQEFRKIWEYIDANPGKWTEDKYYIPIDECVPTTYTVRSDRIDDAQS